MNEKDSLDNRITAGPVHEDCFAIAAETFCKIVENMVNFDIHADDYLDGIRDFDHIVDMNLTKKSILAKAINRLDKAVWQQKHCTHYEKHKFYGWE